MTKVGLCPHQISQQTSLGTTSVAGVSGGALFTAKVLVSCFISGGVIMRMSWKKKDGNERRSRRQENDPLRKMAFRRNYPTSQRVVVGRL